MAAERILVATWWDLGWSRELIRGIREAAPAGWTLELHHPDAPVSDRRGLRAAIAMVPTAAARSLAGRLPLVRLLPATAGRGPAVLLDGGAVGAAAARHLLDLGHRHLAILESGSDGWHAERNRGFRAVAGAVPVQVLPRPGPAFAAALRQAQAPLGLFTGNDSLARDACAACLRLGVAVPQQLAIVGADDDDLFCALARPPLSSVRIPFRRIGEEAARLLAATLAGRQPGASIIQPTGVAVRGSSDHVPSDDRLLGGALAMVRERACAGLGALGAARAAGVSRRTLERRFRDALGHGVHAEIRRRRLREAERLITGSDLPFTEIAARCGYASPSRLCVAVRAAFGMPPGRLRREA